MYIGSLPNLATWFPYGRGKTLFILGSLPLYRLIIYIDGRILWCTHFLFRNKIAIFLMVFFVQFYYYFFLNLLSWELPVVCQWISSISIWYQRDKLNRENKSRFLKFELCLIIYIDGRILWCTHFLFRNKIAIFLMVHQLPIKIIILQNLH
jgi:hypothetical protein